MSNKISFFQVFPRYTAGTPAQVDQEQALRIAGEELKAYEENLSLPFNDPEHSRAKRLGLHGIVESLVEEEDGWHVVDQITKRVSTRPFKKNEKASVRRGEKLVGDPERSIPKSPEEQLHSLRYMTEIDLDHCREQLKSMITFMQGTLSHALVCLEKKPQDAGLNSIGLIQGQGPAIDVVTARYSDAVRRIKQIDALLLGKDPYSFG